MWLNVADCGSEVRRARSSWKEGPLAQEWDEECPR